MNELRIFISSTFRDLQEEREHLVRKIFPEIRALCRERGISFTEVDLRWGLTEEDVVLGQVIRACLEGIDACRPYFIGITGERYGYVPDLVDVYKDAELLKRYPWIEDAAMEGSSIIDLEFRHAALNDGNDQARFYFRRQRRGSEVAVDADEQERLQRLKERVRAAGLSIEEFRDPASLGEMIYDELHQIIERDFAHASAPSELEQERARHEAFAASRRRAYIPSSDYLAELNAWLHDQEAPPLIIYAESGSGKSSLVSFWCQQLRRRDPAAFVIEHYVGIGAGDTDHLGIIRHVMTEIKERFDRSEEIPSKAEELERGFANWLGFTIGAPMLIVLDGINQLHGDALLLRWLPPVMPAGVKLIVTTTVEQTLIDLRGRNWRELAMQPLKEREREGVIVRYLSEYHKALSKEQITGIVEDAKCSHPLFLRTLLEELRLDSSHEKLDERIGTYLRTSGTEDLFQQILERIEDDFSTRAVREVMSLIWCSRFGLSEQELAELTGLSRLKLTTMIGGLDYHLVRRDGVLSFFHDYLRRAVEKRYLSEETHRSKCRLRLAGYFEKEHPTLRSTRELLHVLEAAGERSRLEQILADIGRFQLLWNGAGRFEILRLWSQSKQSDVAAAYHRSIEQWVASCRPVAAQHALALKNVAALLVYIGCWGEAETMYRRVLEIVRLHADRRLESEMLVSLANLTQRLGRMDEAEDLALRAEEIARELADRRLIGAAVGSRGLVHSWRGEYDLALVCHSEQEAIARDLGDQKGIANAVGSRGIVHLYLREYDLALECCAEQEEIGRRVGDRKSIAISVYNRGTILGDRGEHDLALACHTETEQIARQLGDQEIIAVAVGNRGLVHYARGEYDLALACYVEHEQTARQLGDQESIASAVGNRGNLHRHRREFDLAIACHAEHEEIARQLGDQRSIAVAVGNRAAVYADRSEYDQALSCYAQAAALSRAIGDRYSLIHWLAGSARVQLDCPGNDRATSLETARAMAEECVAISRRLSHRECLVSGELVLARVEAEEAHFDAARERLGRLLADADADAQGEEQRAEAHYWLWKLDLDPDNDHRGDAQRAYEDLLSRIPKHDYRLKLEELRVAIPVRSDT